ncbi:MAG: hypothetical protein HQL59_01690 [Magnetococcales bacterium]|nr:hypothetical protein [Magnetococcales bacterium]
MTDWLFQFVPDGFARYRDFPSAVERAELLVSNLSVLVLLLFIYVAIFLLSAPRFRPLLNKGFVGILLLLPWIVRTFWEYAYDTPVGFVCIFSDLFVIYFVMRWIGSLVYFGPYVAIQLTAGVSLVAFVGAFLVLVGIQEFFRSPSSFVHLVVTLLVVRGAVFRRGEFGLIPVPSGLTIAFFLVCSLPFLPFIFSSSPPDSDIIAQTDILGYWYQGFPMFHITAGPAGEWFSLRYPAGFSSLGYFVSHLLNVRASEVTLLLWYFSFPLFVGVILVLTQRLGGNPYLSVLLCLSAPLVAAIRGGQLPELFGYLCGGASVFLISESRVRLAALALSAATFFQPGVAAPFWFVMAVGLVVSLRGWSWWDRVSRNHVLAGVFLLLTCFSYMLFITQGDRIQASIPEEDLRNVSLDVFVRHLVQFIEKFDLFFLVSLVFFAILCFDTERDRRRLSFYMAAWVVGLVLYTAVFGYLPTGAVYMTAGLSHVAFGILGLSAILGILFRLFSQGLFFRSVAFVGCGLAAYSMIGYSHLFHFGSAFSTHSLVRMGRYMEKHLLETALVANVAPPGSRPWMALKGLPQKHALGFMAGGNSIRNVLFSCISSHQIKDGIVLPRAPFQACLDGPTDRVFSCLSGLGVTHLLVDARPETASYAASLRASPLVRFGDTYLYEF